MAAATCLRGGFAVRPFQHAIEHGTKVLAPRRKAVVNTRRFLVVNGSRDQPIVLQATQLLSQHFLGNTVNQALKIREALNLSVKKVEKYQELPSATQQLEYSVHIVGGRLGRVDFFVAHGRHLLFRAFLSRTV